MEDRIILIILDLFDQITSRNTDIKGIVSEGSEGIEHDRENLFHHTEYLNHLIKTFGSEGSRRNEENVTGNWRKGDPCYTVAENLVELHGKDMWKAEHFGNELVYLDEIS